MSWVLVAAGPITGTGALNTAVSPTFGATPQAGNLIVCWVAQFGDTTNPPAGGSYDFLDSSTSLNSVIRTSIQGKTAVGADAQPSFSANASHGVITMLAEFGYGGSKTVDACGTASGVVTSLSPALDGTSANTTAPSSNAARFLGGLLLGSLAASYTSAPGSYSPTVSSTLASSLTDTNNNSTGTTLFANFTWGLITTQASGSPTAITYSGMTATPTQAVAASALMFPVPTGAAQPHGMPRG